MELGPGQSVDRYTLESLLGEGGMASVWLVRHNSLDARHALKVLNISNPGVRARLLQEGRVQARLQHPNIVQVRDVLDVGGSPGLLMEYVVGKPLDAALAERAFPLAEAERIFRAIVAAVRYAHDADVIHRDLKPANVLLAKTPEGWVPKVADFGLAKALGEELTSHKTRTGVAMGTPAYMSPEQIRDARSVDRRTDVFALGAILYELVTGASPFMHDNIMDTFSAVIACDYTPIRELAPAVPERIARAVEACLVVDRDRRLPDCAALLRVLDGERSPIPPETFARVAATRAPPSMATMDPGPSRLPWFAAAFGGIAVVAFVVVVALGGLAWWNSRVEEPVAAPVTVGARPVATRPELPTVQPVVTAPKPAAKPAAAKKAVSPGPVVVPEPAPAPVVEAPPPPTGSTRLVGDASAAWLVGDGRHKVGGDVPPGSYTIEATFADAGTVASGQVSVAAGETITIRCSSAMMRCSAAR